MKGCITLYLTVSARALKIALFVRTHTNQFYLNLWTMSILKIVYSCKYLRLIWNYREL